VKTKSREHGEKHSVFNSLHTDKAGTPKNTQGPAEIRAFVVCRHIDPPRQGCAHTATEEGKAM